MLPPHLADDLLAELRGDIDRAKARILDSLLERLERLSVALEPDDDGDPWSAPPPEPLDADEYRALVVPASAPEPVAAPDEEPVVKAPKTPRRAKAAPADEDAPAPSRVRAPKAVGLVPEPGRGAEAPMPVVAEADTDGPF